VLGNSSNLRINSRARVNDGITVETGMMAAGSMAGGMGPGRFGRTGAEELADRRKLTTSGEETPPGELPTTPLGETPPSPLTTTATPPLRDTAPPSASEISALPPRNSRDSSTLEENSGINKATPRSALGMPAPGTTPPATPGTAPPPGTKSEMLLTTPTPGTTPMATLGTAPPPGTTLEMLSTKKQTPG